jgi:hypothetical protein
VFGTPVPDCPGPSERYWQEHKPGKRQHKRLTDWGRQVMIQAARWLPHRRIIGIGDASFAAIDLLNDVRPWVTMITRLRLDAALHKPTPRRVPGKAGRPPVVGKRQPTLKQRLVNPRTRWRRLLVTGWYGRGERMVEIVSGTAVWNHPGRRVPIRYVLCATRRANSSRKPSSAPISMRTRSTFCAGSSAAGRSRSHSQRSDVISVLRPSGNGPNRQSPAPRQFCSACSP